MQARGSIVKVRPLSAVRMLPVCHHADGPQHGSNDGDGEQRAARGSYNARLLKQYLSLVLSKTKNAAGFRLAYEEDVPGPQRLRDKKGEEVRTNLG